MSLSPLESEIEPVLAAIRASHAQTPESPETAPAPLSGAVPFITISRETGAGGWSLAQRLLDRIHRDQPGQRWTAFDKDKVERLSTDEKTHSTLSDSIEESAHSWLDQLFHGLPNDLRQQPKGEAAFHRVATTIRALAQAGRVIIVGRGGVYLTRGMTGGVHVRLVAPLSFRIREFARRFQVPESVASQTVREIDQRRESFYRRHFPKEALGPQSFTLTLNSSLLSEDAMTDIILAATPAKVAATR